VRPIVALLAVAIVICFAPVAIRAAGRLDASMPSVQSTAIGAGAFVLIWIVLRRRLGFFLTLEHEVTHLLTGLLFLKWPRRLHVHESEGGFVETYGGNFVISLTPYFVPTPALALLALGLAIDRRHTQAFMVAYGAALAYHVISTLRETTMRQPDIQQWGTAFSILVILAGNMLLLGMCLAFITGGYAGMGHYLTDGGRTGQTLARKLATLFG
jgi:hypothetical protein